MDGTTTQDLCEHFSEVVWPGLEKVVWRRICEEVAFDLRSGNTLSLAVHTQTSQA